MRRTARAATGTRNNDGLTLKSKRPIAELTPNISIYWLKRAHIVPDNWYQAIDVQNIQWKLPDIVRLVCKAMTIETENRIGDRQTIQLVWHHPVTGSLPLFICPQCRKRRKILFCHRSVLKCRRCHNCVYFSQIKDARSRPLWQQTKRAARHGKLPPDTRPIVYKATNYYS
jgi:hypothetical protein